METDKIQCGRELSTVKDIEYSTEVLACRAESYGFVYDGEPKTIGTIRIK